MTPRVPLFLMIAAVASCAPHTIATNPAPRPNLTASDLTALACARSQALSLGYQPSSTNGGYSKSYDDGGRTMWDMLAFGIKDAKLFVVASGSPSHTGPSSEALLARNQIERRCAT